MTYTNTNDERSESLMELVPLTGFMRLDQVLKVIPVGKTSWWKNVREGRYPQPVHLSERTTAWRVTDIMELIERLSALSPEATA